MRNVAVHGWPERREDSRQQPRPAACGGPGLSPLGRGFCLRLLPRSAGHGLTAIRNPPIRNARNHSGLAENDWLFTAQKGVHAVV